MSHELRTPLNSLLILAKLLSDNPDGNLTDKQVEFAATIFASGNDLLDLINDILDLSKVEAGKLDVVPERVTLSRGGRLRRPYLPAAGRAEGARVRGRRRPGLRRRSSSPTTLRLQQILKNLLSNAVKFTEHGEGRAAHPGRPGRRRFATEPLARAERVSPST